MKTLPAFHRALLIAAAVMALGAAPPQPGAPPQALSVPKLRIADSKQLPTPLPYPYDEKANATSQVDAAFARARASGKRVLIDFGGNWCPDCRILSGVMELPEVKPFVAEHFEVVAVDVGRFDRNMDVPARFKAKVTGVPWLVIAQPDGTVLHSSYEVTDNGNASKPQAMVNWLAKWAR